MKKIIATIALCLILGVSAHAQWTAVGVRLGTGYATYVDDVRTDHGTWGWSVGGMVEYSFSETNSFILENLSLQTGLHLIRRGYNFEESYEHGMNLSITDGFIHAWYAQIPVIAQFKYELPVKQAGHYITLQLGPAFSVGLFGNYRERKISPHMPQAGMNYDTYITEPKEARRVFGHIRRCDVNFILGLGYQHNYWAFDVYMDYGFIATTTSPDHVKVMEKDDILSGSNPGGVTKGGSNNNNHDNEKPEIDPNKMRTIVPNGNNIAVMAALTYRIPLGGRR